MQKILIYEYITGGGLINEDLTSDLMYEAKLMTNSLYRDCLRSKNVSFKYFQDYRLNSIQKSNSVIVRDKKQFTIIQKEFVDGDYLYIIENSDNKFVVKMNNSEEFYLNELVGVVIKDTNVQIINISL